MPGPVDREPTRRGLVLRTLAAWAGVMLCFGTWSLATPFWTSPDAPAHDLMAWHVGHGNLLPENTDVLNAGVTSNAVTPAPEGLVRSAESLDCYRRQPESPASCMVPVTDDATLVDFINPAGRNFPTYYLATGWPSLLADGAWSLWAMRFAAASLAALFAAWAITAATSRARPVVALAGVVVAMPPMALYLGGAINPNSTEITAAMALAASSVVFLREPETWLGRVMFRRAMVAAAVMVTIRLLAPVWVLVWVVAFALVADRRVWRQVLTRRNLAWAGVPFLGAVFNVVWTLTAGLTEYQAEPKAELSLWEAFWASKTFIDDWGTVASGVGNFGWLDTSLGNGQYDYYFFVAVALVAVSWVFLPGRATLVTGWLLVAAYLAPVVLQAGQWNTNGGVWQGRYTLPLAVMVPIITMMLAADRMADPRPAARAVLDPIARRIVLALPVLLAVLGWVHWKALEVQLQRNIRGVSGAVPVEDQWQPALAETLLLWLLGVTLALAWLAFTLAAVRQARALRHAPAGTAPAGPDTPAADDTPADPEPPTGDAAVPETGADAGRVPSGLAPSTSPSRRETT